MAWPSDASRIDPHPKFAGFISYRARVAAKAVRSGTGQILSSLEKVASGMDITGYSRGTLVVDIWKRATEELIWRGAVMGVVPDNPSPKKSQKVIEKALNAIGKEWRKQRP